MPSRAPSHTLLTLGLAGLLVLPACQGMPGTPTPGAPRIQLAPVAGQALRVTIRSADRHVAAVAADVAALAVTVRAADGQAFMRELDPAALPGAAPSVTFTNLPAGPAWVQVTALGASNQSLGQAEHVATLEGGVTTDVAITLRLSESTGLPAPAPTSATVGVTLIDGPVLPGPPTPSPTPFLFLGRQLLKWENAADFGSAIVANSRGYIWVLSAMGGMMKLASDASVLANKPLPPGASSHAVAIDSQDNLWLTGAGKLHKLSPEGDLLGSYNVPVEAGTRGLALDPSGQIWIANGRQVYRISPAGAVLDTHTLSADAGAVAVDRTSGTAWVLLPYHGQVLRFSATGMALPAVTINQTADALMALAVDAEGNAWVGQNWSGAVAKIAPDGRHLGQFRTANPVSRIIFDSQGNAIVGPDRHSTGLYAHATKLTPDGRVLGHYRTDYFIDAAIDAAGDLWSLSMYGSDSPYLLKFAL